MPSPGASKHLAGAFSSLHEQRQLPAIDIFMVLQDLDATRASYALPTRTALLRRMCMAWLIDSFIEVAAGDSATPIALHEVKCTRHW